MRSLFQSLGIVPHATMVDTEPTSSANKLMKLIEGRSYAEASRFLRDATDYESEHLLWSWGDLPNSLESAQTWVAEDRRCTDAQLLLGFAHLGEGARLRGTTYYSDIPKARKVSFPKAFEKAHAVLTELAGSHDAPAMAFYGLLQCGLVCGIESERRDEWFNRAMEMAPFHAPSISVSIKTRMEKWGGSDEEMWHFMRWVSDSAPRGSDALAHVAWHFVESSYPFIEECCSPLELVGRLSTADAGDWMREVFLNWLDSAPEDAAERIGQFDSLSYLSRKSTFALALYLSGAWAEARVVLASMQGRVPRDPWFVLSFLPLSLLDRLMNGDRRHAGLAYDRICRDLGLDPRLICQSRL